MIPGPTLNPKEQNSKRRRPTCALLIVCYLFQTQSPPKKRTAESPAATLQSLSGAQRPETLLSQEREAGSTKESLPYLLRALSSGACAAARRENPLTFGLNGPAMGVASYFKIASQLKGLERDFEVTNGAVFQGELFCAW